jgi:NAD(P)-dependent dehydrogenase (short-subunit alcohol dehydrogenase family)
MRLQDKVAIITGGAGKIGSAYAQGMAREGAKVCLADRVSGGHVVDAIEQAGGEAVSLECDVSDARSVQAMVDAAAERFGGVDILVNNAAYFHPFIQRGLFWEIDVDDFDKAMAINVRGPWLCARAAFPYLKARGKGKIINIASGQALQGGENYIHYVASKGAVISMTRAMARELGEYNICVNTIAPGFVTTRGREVSPEHQRRMDERRSLKRPQVEEDLVGTAIYLASADSDFVTGQLLVVDGGGTFV